MAKSIEAQDSGSRPVGKITTVAEAVQMFGPEFLAELASALAPQLQKLSSGNVRKVYEIEAYTGQHVVEEFHRVPLLDEEGQHVTNDKGRKQYTFEPRKRTVTGGWMVYLPQGHSLYVETKEQLERLGLTSESGLVDMNTGYRFEDQPESFKSMVARNTQHTPRSRRSGDGSLAGDLNAVISAQE